MKRSMNVNIFLRQFKASNDDIIKLLKDGDETKIGQEKLKGLLNILPADFEREMITGFNGDPTKLGNAENFFWNLLRLPAYQMRIEGMLMKAEFQSSHDKLLPDIIAVKSSCKAILENQSLKEFLRYALHTGNFINAVSNVKSCNVVGMLYVSKNYRSKVGFYILFNSQHHIGPDPRHCHL